MAGAFALLSAPREAWADAPPIEQNDYALELFQGPLLAPVRITGLAGATTATAQSLEGVYNNAAAPAVREPYSLDHFEWEPTGGISFPGTFGGTDFNNRGEKGISEQIERNRSLGHPAKSTVETTDRFLYLNGGLWGQLGSFGLTATVDILRYDIGAQTQSQSSLSVGITRLHVVGAYGFLNNQLCVGLGVRMANLDLNEINGDSPVVTMFGVGPQAGLIVKPEGRSWRVGVTGRGPVSSSFDFGNVTREERTDGTTIRRAGTFFIVPDRIVQPWELEAGVAYQLGPRPLNPSWVDPVVLARERQRVVAERRSARANHRRAEVASMPDATPFDRATRASRLAEMGREEAAIRAGEDLELQEADARVREEQRARYLNWPREHVLLLASVLMTGASEDAVALEGFIDQRREIVGSRVTVAPRFAIESEPIPNRLKTRAGVYLEPSRFRDGNARQHFTVGFDVRVLSWDVFGLFPHKQWRLSAFLDAAERYQNFGIGLGVWH
ncbi:MAG TPA: hypothetical protein VM580_28000 [Labilithrix sp.]|nr:hypothetical protein [Labilithrix sp.]